MAIFYRSANFDEEVFGHPERFDILRDPNPHVGFGGTGAHYCVGANLARMTIDLMFNAIADGTFGVTRRPADGGRGLDGVVERAEGYFNPAAQFLEGGQTASQRGSGRPGGERGDRA